MNADARRLPPMSIFATGMTAGLRRLAKIRMMESISLREAITVVSDSRFCLTARIPVIHFSFQPSAAPPAFQGLGSRPRSVSVGLRPSLARPRRTVTRIKPPSDIVKLADRLYYLLQPPIESLINAGDVELPFDPFPYQWEGVAFLYPRVAAILADEMGLGKTMQAITALRLLIRAGEIKQALLICPKPLVPNWRREFETWASEIPIVYIHGKQARREWQWRNVQAPIKIANYELLLRDQEILKDESLHFDLVVLDEAQRIKNRHSTTSQVVRSIHRRRSWALTGTPVENHSDDLYGIFEFLSPGFLSPDMTPRRMAKVARDYILRRTKDKVLTDLPPKLYRDASLKLTREQQDTYEQAESQGTIKLNELGDALTVQHVFELVLRLKQICNFDPATGCSSKLERLLVDLEEVAASGRKAIIFSQWVGVLEKLAEHMPELHPLQYHGRVPHARREGVLKQFKEDRRSHVLLMTYGAGSVGLNLQFASYVFLFDRWWNPAVEDQAINRAHRIGAAGPVTVTKFVMLNTIEERIDSVLEQKRELFEMMLSGTETTQGKLGLTQDEIFGLFPKVRKAAA